MKEVAKPRRKSLLEHFSAIKDNRQPCKVMYPLSEVLLLVVCGTIAACDDYDDIVLWGISISISCGACNPTISAFPAPTGCGW